MLNRTWEEIPLIKPPKTSRIPDILNVEQLNKLFAATNKLSYRVFFFTIYSLGLRLGEGIRLTVGDIDPTRMRGSYPQWIEQQQGKLLPSIYYLVTFTIPSQLTFTFPAG